jgi:hypothetical protein
MSRVDLATLEGPPRVGYASRFRWRDVLDPFVLDGVRPGAEERHQFAYRTWQFRGVARTEKTLSMA